MSESNSEYKIECIVKVGKRGQFVLPKELRNKASINVEDKLAILTLQNTYGTMLILKKTEAFRIKKDELTEF